MSTKDDPFSALARQPADHIWRMTWRTARHNLHLNHGSRILKQLQPGMCRDSHRGDIKIEILDQPPACMDGRVDSNNSHGYSLFEKLKNSPVALGNINPSLCRQFRLCHIPIENKNSACNWCHFQFCWSANRDNCRRDLTGWGKRVRKGFQDLLV